MRLSSSRALYRLSIIKSYIFLLHHLSQVCCLFEVVYWYFPNSRCIVSSSFVDSIYVYHHWEAVTHRIQLRKWQCRSITWHVFAWLSLLSTRTICFLINSCTSSFTCILKPFESIHLCNGTNPRISFRFISLVLFLYKRFSKIRSSIDHGWIIVKSSFTSSCVQTIADVLSNEMCTFWFALLMILSILFYSCIRLMNIKYRQCCFLWEVLIWLQLVVNRGEDERKCSPFTEMRDCFFYTHLVRGHFVLCGVAWGGYKVTIWNEDVRRDTTKSVQETRRRHLYGVAWAWYSHGNIRVIWRNTK